MDKYLSDKRVEAAVNRAVKSITDNPHFAQTGEDWRQKSMTLEQENEAIRKKLDKVTKDLEKVKKEAAREIGNFNDAEDHKAILKEIVGKGYANDESGRHLLRKDAAAIVEKIQATAKGDLLGQMQLAEAVKRRAPQERALTSSSSKMRRPWSSELWRCKSKRDASSRARSLVSPTVTMTSRPSHACLS